MLPSLLSISSAVVWVDFITLALHKTFDYGKSLDMWYKQFGIVAALSDCLIIILGILIAQFLMPGLRGLPLAGLSIVVQMIHDVLFYIFVIKGVPQGHNAMIDLFKSYANENSYKILIADALMISGTVMLAEGFETIDKNLVIFMGLLAVYALTYIIYTK